MPELPDLHVFSINLKKRLIDKTISQVRIFNPRKIDRPDSFRETLTGTRVKDIARDGKELFFRLANENTFGVHLMLNGRFFFSGENDAENIGGKMAALYLDGGEAFTIADFQGLCKVTLNPVPPKVPDALSEKFTFQYFTDVIRKNARNNIKAVLIDQHVVRGIGNAYVDEILWKADISPESIAGKIPEEKVKSLYEAVPFILNDAIENILKISPDIISGEERSFLRVHNPKKQFTHEGDRIIKKTIASKITYFTEKQKLYI